MVVQMKTVVAQKQFGVDDRWGPVSAKKGDVITISEGLAVRLAKKGWVKKYRKPAKKAREK